MATITTISSNGQVVLPLEIRKEFDLTEGVQMVVLTYGDNILLKPMKMTKRDSFEQKMAANRQWAKKVGMTEADIIEAIAEVRKAKRR